MPLPDPAFAAAIAVVRAGAARDEAGLRALIDTRDRDELVDLVLASGALAQLLGLLATGGDRHALDEQLTHILHSDQ